MHISRTLVHGAGACALALAGGTLTAQEDAANPLFERLGGLPGISIVMSDFIDAFIDDPEVMANPAVRERKTAENAPYLKFQVTALLCEVTGGPCRYTGENLRDAHEGLNITMAEWDRMVEIFSRTLDEHGVAETEQQELFAILGPTQSDIVAAGN